MERLLSIIEKEHINLDFTDLPENGSIACLISDDCYIAIDRHMRGAELRVHAAHEVGHCTTGSFYNFYSPFDVRAKHERRANEWAINQLVPEQEYLTAIRHGVRSAYELAECFDITEDFARKVIAYYNEVH